MEEHVHPHALQKYIGEFQAQHRAKFTSELIQPPASYDFAASSTSCTARNQIFIFYFFQIGWSIRASQAERKPSEAVS